MSRKYFIFTVCFFLCIFVLMGLFVFSSAQAQVSRPVQAVSKKIYEQAKEHFRRIRSEDPEIREREKWEDVAREFQNFLNNYEDAPEAHLATFLLAQLFENIYQVRGDKTSLANAVFYYQKLIDNYSYSPFVEAAKKARTQLTQRSVKTKPSTLPSTVSSTGSSTRPTIRRQEVNRKSAPVVIVVDPGHGGEELGAIGIDGVYEKDVVLNISLYLEQLLIERLGAQVYLTRRDDSSVPLSDRTKLANDKQADLFLSIHANASENRKLQGIETYYLDNTNDKSSLKLASRENATLMQDGNDLGFIISDFIQSAKLGESISLAHYLHRSMISTMTRHYPGVRDLSVKKAPFYVLVGAHMPCVLAEVSFIDHPQEGQRLATKRYQQLLAQALFQGINSFLKQHRR